MWCWPFPQRRRRAGAGTRPWPGTGGPRDGAFASPALSSHVLLSQYLFKRWQRVIYTPNTSNTPHQTSPYKPHKIYIHYKQNQCTKAHHHKMHIACWHVDIVKPPLTKRAKISFTKYTFSLIASWRVVYEWYHFNVKTNKEESKKLKISWNRYFPDAIVFLVLDDFWYVKSGIYRVNRDSFI